MGQGPGPGSRRPRAEARAGPRRARGGADQPGRTRTRLAQCELSATQSTSPRAVRAQRDKIRLRSIRASPPGAMRAQVTSPKQLPQGWGRANGAPDSGPHPDSPGSGTQADGAPTDATIEPGPAPPSPVRKAHRISGEDAGRLGDRRKNAERLQQRALSRGRNNLAFPTPQHLLPALIALDADPRPRKLRPPRRARRTKAPGRRSRR